MYSLSSLSSKLSLHRRRRTNFKRINEFFVCGLHYLLEASQWAHLCGLVVSYGAWRAVRGAGD